MSKVSWTRILLVILIAIIAVAGTFLIVEEEVSRAPIENTEKMTEIREERILESYEKLVKSTVQEARKAVVTVRAGQSEGAGFLVDNNIIVTADHIFDHMGRYDTIEVIDYEGNKWEAKEKDSMYLQDLALLETQYLELPTLELAKEVEIGSTAIAIGTPMEMPNSATRGIISNVVLDAQVGDTKFVQFDAAISPGNSGGPIIDINGKVLGVAVLKGTDYGVEGMGFATHIRHVRELLGKDVGEMDTSGMWSSDVAENTRETPRNKPYDDRRFPKE